MEYLQPDWTIRKTLDYLSELYQDRKSALDALWRAAREARIKITGCRCKWVNRDAIEIGERENIRDIAWVDLAFEMRGDWAAVRQLSSPHNTKTLPPAWWSEPTKSQAAEGWCRLRIYRVDVLPAFPKPLKPDQAENLARFARLVAPLAPAASVLGLNETDKPPVVEASSDKPKPSKQKERRQVREAIEALADAPGWSGLKAEPRMRRIEKHLNWTDRQCKRRTYDRALGDFERAKSAVAPVGEVAQVPASP